MLNGNKFLIGLSSFTVLLRQQPELFGGGDETEVAPVNHDCFAADRVAEAYVFLHPLV